ncbi:hypothetical protein [Halospeciosus flavus]|uniref:hypothetical protein n=1 Tax=Halospeciosus flavus TaxID=3032283 RepID=UPI00360EC126
MTDGFVLLSEVSGTVPIGEAITNILSNPSRSSSCSSADSSRRSPSVRWPTWSPPACWRA